MPVGGRAFRASIRALATRATCYSRLHQDEDAMRDVTVAIGILPDDERLQAFSRWIQSGGAKRPGRID